MWADSGAWLQDVAQRLDRLTIDQLIALHERVVAPLCPAAKRRLVRAAAAPAASADDRMNLPAAA
jgi:hypothetical protein